MLAKEYLLEMEGADPAGIHQLVPEYLKTALRNLSEDPKRGMGIRVAAGLCSPSFQKTPEFPWWGFNNQVYSELFSLHLFPNSFFLTPNFHTFSRSSKAPWKSLGTMSRAFYWVVSFSQPTHNTMPLGKENHRGTQSSQAENFLTYSLERISFSRREKLGIYALETIV